MADVEQAIANSITADGDDANRDTVCDSNREHFDRFSRMSARDSVYDRSCRTPTRCPPREIEGSPLTSRAQRTFGAPGDAAREVIAPRQDGRGTSVQVRTPRSPDFGALSPPCPLKDSRARIETLSAEEVSSGPVTTIVRASSCLGSQVPAKGTEPRVQSLTKDGTRSVRVLGSFNGYPCSKVVRKERVEDARAVVRAATSLSPPRRLPRDVSPHPAFTPRLGVMSLGSARQGEARPEAPPGKRTVLGPKKKYGER